MSDPFDALFGRGPANDEPTLARIADAAELSAAIAAVEFFTERGMLTPADRMVKLVEEMSKRMAKRHGV